MIINRSYIGVYSITDTLLKRTADVNGDGKITPLDALLVNRRYIGVYKKFKIPDWLYSRPVIKVNGEDVIQEIKAVCAGDVTGSYIPK